MHPDEMKLTAYALGELEPAEECALAEHLHDCAACQQAVEATRKLGGVLSEQFAKEPLPERSVTLQLAVAHATTRTVKRPTPRIHRWAWISAASAAAAASVLVIASKDARQYARSKFGFVSNQVAQGPSAGKNLPSPYYGYTDDPNHTPLSLDELSVKRSPGDGVRKDVDSKSKFEFNKSVDGDRAATNRSDSMTRGLPAAGPQPAADASPQEPLPVAEFRRSTTAATSQPTKATLETGYGGQGQGSKATSLGRVEKPQLQGAAEASDLSVVPGAAAATAVDKLHPASPMPAAPPVGQVVTGNGFGGLGGMDGVMGRSEGQVRLGGLARNEPGLQLRDMQEKAKDVEHNTEAYNRIDDNPFREVHDHPLSTFSIDVDTASYSNVRRFLTSGSRPPKDAVRIEELLNYFAYDYSPPQDDKPFATACGSGRMPLEPGSPAGADCPEGPRNRPRTTAGQQPGLSARRFGLDAAGEQAAAGEAGHATAGPKAGRERSRGDRRLCRGFGAGAPLDHLRSEGIDPGVARAFAIRRLDQRRRRAFNWPTTWRDKNFIKGGTNRVILCTDGDFNVGITDQNSLTQLIEEKAASGVFLSVLGFGMGNLKDDDLETLADQRQRQLCLHRHEKEAKKVLVDQMSGTLVTIAKDVKIQIEFNPAQVAGYRLIGYENRILQAEDFNDDKKDAGDIGAGHTVTALYEIVPAGQTIGQPAVDPLKYQKPAQPRGGRGRRRQPRAVTLKLRYKEPDGQTSRLLEYPITDSNHRFAESSNDFRFAAAVAEFGMVLRDSPHKGNATLDSVLELAHEGKGPTAKAIGPSSFSWSAWPRGCPNSVCRSFSGFGPRGGVSAAWVCTFKDWGRHDSWRTNNAADNNSLGHHGPALAGGLYGLQSNHVGLCRQPGTAGLLRWSRDRRARSRPAGGVSCRGAGRVGGRVSRSIQSRPTGSRWDQARRRTGPHQ